MEANAGRRMHCSGSFRALEEALWRAIGQVRGSEPLAPILVVVPTNLLRRHLTLAGAERGGFFNIRFLTLIDLAARLGAADLAEEGLAPMPGLADEVIARAVCASQEPGYFGPIAHLGGFHRALLETITDLKEWGASPQALRAAADRLRERDSALAGKLADLARLWSAYEGRLRGAGLYDDCDLVAAAADAAPNSGWLDQAVAVFVYGFYDLNPLQRRLVAATLEGRRGEVFFPYEATAAFEFARPTLQWFQSLGFEVIEEPADAALAPFQRRLFEAPAGEAAAADSLSIVSAPDERREVGELVRRVVALARQGQSLPRVGVLLRQSDVYAPLFREECELGGLAAYHHRPLPLAETRSGRSFLMFLELLASDLARAEVMDFLTYADLAVEDACPSDWDALSLEAGVTKGAESWRRQLTSLHGRLATGGPGEEEVEEDEEKRQGRLAALDGFQSFIERFLALVEALPRQGKWSEMVEATSGAFRQIVRESEGREAVLDVISGLATLDATGEAADLEFFATLAARGLESRHVERAPFGSRGPVVVDIMEGRGLPFEVTVVPGLVERSFPPPPGSDPLLADGERRLMARFGIRLPLKRERLAEEQLLFRLAVGSAGQRVVLSYPRLDAFSGRERVPSHFLLRAVEAATGQPCDYEGFVKFPGHVRLPTSAFVPLEPERSWRRGEYDLAATIEAVRKQDADEAAFVVALVPTAAQALRAEAERWARDVFTPYDGCLGDPGPLRRLLGHPPLWFSPTALERYARCPFKFFLTDVLRLEAVEEPDPIARLSGLDRGRLVHKALYRAATRAREAGRVPLADEEVVVQAAEEVFEEFEEEGVPGSRALWGIERAELLEELRVLVAAQAAESDFVPAHFEVFFGRGATSEDGLTNTEEGLTIELSPTLTIRLRGRIDRIDLHGTAPTARVIDYKTGRKPKGLGKNKLAGGEALQLPLYLMAAARLLPDRQVAEAAYWFMTRRGGYERVGFDAEALGERQGDLMGILRTIAEGIVAGRFFAAAGDACRSCDFRLVCGAWSRVLAERKSADEAAKDYFAMREMKD